MKREKTLRESMCYRDLKLGDIVYVYRLIEHYSIHESFDMALKNDTIFKGIVIDIKEAVITGDSFNIRNGEESTIYKILGEDGKIYHGTHDILGDIYNLRKKVNCGVKNYEELIQCFKNSISYHNYLKEKRNKDINEHNEECRRLIKKYQDD